MKKILMLFIALASLQTLSANRFNDCFSCCFCDVHGKWDIGPVVMDLDELKDGQLIESNHMKGIAANGTLVWPFGLAVKPDLMYAFDGAVLWRGGLGVGIYYPVNCDLSVSPVVGYSWTTLRSEFDYPSLTGSKKRSNSRGPYVGLDIAWKFHCKWMATVSAKYGWSKAFNTLSHPAMVGTYTDGKYYHDDVEVKGPSVNLLLDYFINDCWAVQLAYAYNKSLTKEKIGQRAKGGRIAISYMH